MSAQAPRGPATIRPSAPSSALARRARTPTASGRSRVRRPVWPLRDRPAPATPRRDWPPPRRDRDAAPGRGDRPPRRGRDDGCPGTPVPSLNQASADAGSSCSACLIGRRRLAAPSERMQRGAEPQAEFRRGLRLQGQRKASAAAFALARCVPARRRSPPMRAKDRETAAAAPSTALGACARIDRDRRRSPRRKPLRAASVRVRRRVRSFRSASDANCHGPARRRRPASASRNGRDAAARLDNAQRSASAGFDWRNATAAIN